MSLDVSVMERQRHENGTNQIQIIKREIKYINKKNIKSISNVAGKHFFKQKSRRFTCSAPCTSVSLFVPDFFFCVFFIFK